MVKVLFFLLALVLSFDTIKCGLLAKIRIIAEYSGKNINTPEKLEKVITLVLKEKIRSAQVDSETSLFSLLNPIVAPFSGISENEQNKIYTEALFDHMNKACLSTIVKIKRGQLMEQESTEIIQKIWLTSHESEFFNNFKTKLKIPDKTVIFMLKVLDSLNLNTCNTRGMILKLAPFCESETCQELVYSSILHSLNYQNKKFPFIRIKYNLKETEKYDVFISTCCEIYESERSNIIPLDNLIQTIFNGPGTAEAAKTLLKIVDKDNLIKISRHKESINHLTRFLLNTRTFDEISRRFFSDTDENENESIAAMKVQMLTIKENYDSITEMTKVSPVQLNDGKLIEYMDHLGIDRDLLKRYFDIDPDFVTSTIRQLNIEIFRLVDSFNSFTDCKKKLVIISVAFIILCAIPVFHLREFDIIDYEPLLDAYLKPELLLLDSNIVADHLGLVVILPFAKLEISTLEKLFIAFNRCGTKEYAEERFHVATTLALYWRHFNDQIFLESLHTFADFYESNHLEMNCIILPLLGKFLNHGEYFIARKWIELCHEKKMLPKTYDILCDRYLDYYGYK